MNSETREHLEKKRERNRKQRREFVKYWAEYIKSHDDEDWSAQQNVILNAQLESE